MIQAPDMGRQAPAHQIRNKASFSQIVNFCGWYRFRYKKTYSRQY